MEQSGQQHDTWGSLAVKVLPLFNGEGLKLSIEDLNELVRRCINDSIRRLVLKSFRDHVILPMGNRIEDAFDKLFHDFDSGIPVTDTATRMLQMSYILSSVLSDDDNQRDMDRILDSILNTTTDNLVTNSANSMKLSNPISGFSSATSL
ncbi:unnamed protein product [Rhizophagus irregularis]|nr:unnamed protein product [Rhizophagus irregularis]